MNGEKTTEYGCYNECGIENMAQRQYEFACAMVMYEKYLLGIK